MTEKSYDAAVNFPTAYRCEQWFSESVFTRCAEDAITDEQVERMIGPVIGMIRAGVFDRPRREWHGVSPPVN